MDKSICIAQLRLQTLAYIADDMEDASLKCFDEMFELCKLSRLLVRLLDEIHVKLSESQENSIDYQISSQQLVYFTSEWYDNLAGKLNETFELAARQDINVDVAKTKQGGSQQQHLVAMGSSELRIRDALLRLKQSMGENERLIGAIANNIDYTRATIEAIYESLRSAKLGLKTGQRETYAAVEQVFANKRQKLICFFALLVLAGVASLLGVYCILKIFI